MTQTPRLVPSHLVCIVTYVGCNCVHLNGVTVPIGQGKESSGKETSLWYVGINGVVTLKVTDFVLPHPDAPIPPAWVDSRVDIFTGEPQATLK